jgi:hypothetical protein
MSAARLIQGYYQPGGGCLVTIDGQVLGLPALEPGREARHSPDGFQWGYGGSGPAELARALLIACLPWNRMARHPRCYQAFKADVIARLPQRDFTLASTDVEAWYAVWAAEQGADLERILADSR